MLPMGSDDTVLVLAPTGRDAHLIACTLSEAEIGARICPSLEALCDSIDRGAGAAVIADEVLNPRSLQHLSNQLANQPTWSDFPLVVLTQQGAEGTDASWHTMSVVESAGNVTLLERPVHEITLLSAVKVALRARAKQYQVRDYLRQKDEAEQALLATEDELRKQTEDLDWRVRQRTKELERANKELEAFTYSIAHDLRSPLRRLMFSSEIIQCDYEDALDSEGKSTLQQLAHEAKKLSTLVEDLLQYARLGQQPVTAELIDASAIALAVAQQFQEQGDLRYSIEPGIMVCADPNLLELVFQNLFENAYKYRADSIPPAVSVTFAPEEDAIVVEDNGIGFDMKFADKVFQPFERLHRDTDYPGSGIGLANVKRIVERHGGRIWAKSREGHGSSFFFTLGEGMLRTGRRAEVAQS